MMVFLSGFCGIFVLCACVALSHASINDHFKYWETLTVSNIQRRIVKRDIVTSQTQEETVKFNSFGRQFALFLRKDLSILAPGFKLFVFKEDGKKHETHLNVNLFRGTVEGEDDSFVSAYFDNHQVLSASIQTSKETYTVEPASNLSPGAPNDTMIIYKGANFNRDNSSVCGYVTDKEDSAFVDETRIENDAQKNRSKRQACNPSKNTCHLYLVADPLFYKVKGKSSVNVTATYMLKVIAFIDRIYRATDFPTCGKNFGFEVKTMNIFESYNENYIYTNSSREYSSSQFLGDFKMDKELKKVCLGHLFTHRLFINKKGNVVLGLAYLAGPRPDDEGGICSAISGLSRSNSGWTTYAGRFGTLPDLTSTLVTAHEVAHSWGSPHDPDNNPECSPPASSGGKYIVYPIQVNGRDKNNKLFSRCSIAAMGDVLSTKSDCFEPKKKELEKETTKKKEIVIETTAKKEIVKETTTKKEVEKDTTTKKEFEKGTTMKKESCGDYRLENGEECDVGSDGDNCCTANCILKPNARCSKMNHACCTGDCQIIANKDESCYMPTVEECFLPAFCDGVSSNCPSLKPKPDGSSCSYKGECRNGRCIHLCRLHNYSSCMCDTMDDGCKWCCIKENQECSPLVLDGAIQYLGEGISCIGGMCDNRGRCIASVSGFILRLWQILDLSSPGAFVKFMRNNVVSTVIIISLVLWIPASCYICYLDRREKRERHEMINTVVDGVLKGNTAKVEPPSPTDSRRAKTKKQIGMLTNQALSAQQTKDKPATDDKSAQQANINRRRL